MVDFNSLEGEGKQKAKSEVDQRLGENKQQDQQQQSNNQDQQQGQ